MAPKSRDALPTTPPCYCLLSEPAPRERVGTAGAELTPPTPPCYCLLSEPAPRERVGTAGAELTPLVFMKKNKRILGNSKGGRNLLISSNAKQYTHQTKPRCLVRMRRCATLFVNKDLGFGNHWLGQDNLGICLS